VADNEQGAKTAAPPPSRLERVYDLGPLRVPADHELVAIVFLTRAGDYDKGMFHVRVKSYVDPDNPGAAAEIVRDVLVASTTGVETMTGAVAATTPLTDDDRKKGA